VLFEASVLVVVVGVLVILPQYAYLFERSK